jgi:omega-6 fatty acid desaturase (delta-12 desaturase)
MQQRGTKAPVAQELKVGPPKPTKSCYKKVAEDLPSNVTLKDIMDTLPKEVFEKSYFKGAFACLTTFVFTALGMYLIHLAPWYLLPIMWILAGTAACGLFVLGHDCGHRSLFPSVWVNDIVGTVLLSVLVYPYHPWRIQHNFHHANTNRLHVDNAWQPTNPEAFPKYNIVIRVGLRLVKGPLWFVGSIGHLIMEHFDINAYTKDQQAGVRQSYYACGIFALTVFPILYKYAGVYGLLKYYILPWIVFHFWMSTFTLVHHTLPHIPFLGEKEWSPIASRLTFTVHADYPFWVEFLCHDINVHIPHHLSTGIPSYNLRLAHKSLKQNWGKYMHEAKFGWELMYDIATTCHMYHDKNYYQTFAAFWQAANE